MTPTPRINRPRRRRFLTRLREALERGDRAGALALIRARGNNAEPRDIVAECARRRFAGGILEVAGRCASASQWIGPSGIDSMVEWGLPEVVLAWAAGTHSDETFLLAQAFCRDRRSPPWDVASPRQAARAHGTFLLFGAAAAAKAALVGRLADVWPDRGDLDLALLHALAGPVLSWGDTERFLMILQAPSPWEPPRGRGAFECAPGDDELVATVQTLLDAGADLHAFGGLPLVAALGARSRRAVEILIGRGADPLAIRPPAVLALLMQAVPRGHPLFAGVARRLMAGRLRG